VVACACLFRVVGCNIIILYLELDWRSFMCSICCRCCCQRVHQSRHVVLWWDSWYIAFPHFYFILFKDKPNKPFTIEWCHTINFSLSLLYRDVVNRENIVVLQKLCFGILCFTRSLMSRFPISIAWLVPVCEWNFFEYFSNFHEFSLWCSRNIRKTRKSSEFFDILWIHGTCNIFNPYTKSQTIALPGPGSVTPISSLSGQR